MLALAQPAPTLYSLPPVLLALVAEDLAPADACRLGCTAQWCRVVAHGDALWTRTLRGTRALATLTARVYKSATLERTPFDDDGSTWLVRKRPAVAQPGVALLPWQARRRAGEEKERASLPGALRKYVEFAALKCAHCDIALLDGCDGSAGDPVSSHGCPLCADGSGPRLMAAMSEPGGLSKCKVYCGECHCSCSCSACAMDETTALTLTGRSLTTASCAQCNVTLCRACCDAAPATGAPRPEEEGDEGAGAGGNGHVSLYRCECCWALKCTACADVAHCAGCDSSCCAACSDSSYLECFNCGDMYDDDCFFEGEGEVGRRFLPSLRFAFLRFPSLPFASLPLPFRSPRDYPPPRAHGATRENSFPEGSRNAQTPRSA